MDIETRVEGDATVARLCDARLDAAAAVRFKENLRQVIDDGAQVVVIDMAAVGFMDSSGLGAIVTVLKFMGPDRTLHLTGLTAPVAKVFALTRMDRVFSIHDSVADALDAGEKVTG